MNAIRLERTIEKDGELHLADLPCRRGDRVEAIVLVLPQTPDEEKREEALQRYLARAKSSGFCSTGPYPTREELHERI